MGNSIKSILDYWFGEIREEAGYLEERERLWFGGLGTVDQMIRERFAEGIDSAQGAGWDGWASTPLGRLALILLLDQFTRNVFRGTPRAFSGDAKALRLCTEGLDAGSDRLLHPVHRSFFYLPLEHSEDLSTQRRSIQCFEKLAREAPAPLRPGMEDARDYAVRHFAIVERFGRFPHRNAILGRVSTEAELAFLAEPGSSF